MTSGIKSRVYSVQIRRIDVQTMMEFVKIKQVEPNILRWTPFPKNENKIKTIIISVFTRRMCI